MIALLLIRPGPLRDGMDALMVSIPDVQLVAHSNDAETALDFCRQNKADLIVIEVRPDDRDLLNIVSEMKALCTEGNVLALIHDENNRLSAEMAQVDLVLSIGTPAAKLKVGIDGLIHSSMEESA